MGIEERLDPYKAVVIDEKDVIKMIKAKYEIQPIEPRRIKSGIVVKIIKLFAKNT